MKRRATARLTLHRETLHQLDQAGLRGVAGADTAAVACYTQPPTCRKGCSFQLTCAATCTDTTTRTTDDTATA